MAEQRIKGQETEVLFIANGVPQDNLTAVRSFEIAAQMEILREGYLGETTDRRDDVFRGIRGRMEIHLENESILNLWTTIVDRARRREPNIRINVKSVLQFPNGQRPIIVLPDVFFGELPMTFPDRGSYLTSTFDFEADTFRFAGLST